MIHVMDEYRCVEIEMKVFVLEKRVMNEMIIPLVL